MELAFVFLHVGCPALDPAISTSPPKLGFEGSEDGLPLGTDKLHLRCPVCGVNVDVTIETKVPDVVPADA